MVAVIWWGVCCVLIFSFGGIYKKRESKKINKQQLRLGSWVSSSV